MALAWVLLAGGAQAQPRDTVTMGLAQFPADMHPFITNLSVKSYILAAGLRGMTGFSKDGRVICVLCTELPTLANGRAKITKRADGTDGMETLFTLKPDLFWADGVQVTAKDVVFAAEVDRAFSVPPVIEKVEAVDAMTVKVTLKRPSYDFDRQTYGPISAHVEEPIFRAAASPLDYGQKSAFNRAPETPGLWMGPYRIETFKPNQSIELVPNAQWKGAAPYFKRVSLKLVENTAALQANLLAGDVDLVGPGNLGLTLDQINALAKSQGGRFDFAFEPSVASYEHLAVNLDNPLLADKRVRHALSMAIDRKLIVSRLFENRFEPAGSFKHPTQFGYDASVKPWFYDPPAAKALLAEAGFKPGADGILISPAGERFSVDIITTSGNRTRELIEQVLQTQFRAIGVDLVIKNEPARVMFGETLRKRNFKGLVELQSDQPLDWVPLTTMSSAWIPSEKNNYTGSNYMGLRSPAMDAALLAAQTELDAGKRRALWKTILDIASDEMPEINLYFPATATMTPKWMTGLVSTTRWGNATNWIEEWKAK
jgi:peptide/nickel transport system substrate-binding protein